MNFRKTITLLFALLILVGGTKTTNAIYCSNCSTVVQGWAIQAQATITAGAAPIIATQQTLSTVKQTITDPIRDAVTLITIAKSGNLIKNLVLGSLDNETRSFIENPTQYVEDEAKKQVALNLSQVKEAQGLFSESILKQTIDATKQSSDVEGTLKSLSQSSVPSIVQNNLCLDATLSEVAKNDVKKEDGTYDNLDLQIRKQQLYDSLCVGDPNTDPVLAKTLSEVNAARPEIGGWDSWLAVTSGDNEYTKGTKARQIILAEQQKVAEEKIKDLDRGNGIASKTECTQWKTTIMNGVSQEICQARNITNLGYQLSESYKEAINAPLKVLLNSYGTGAVTGIFGDVISIMGSVNSVQGALYAGGSTGGGTGNTSSVIKTTPTNDLSSDAARKSQIVSSPQKQLNLHLTTLNALTITDNQYLSSILSYQSQIGTIKNCYDQLVTNYPSLSGDVRITNAFAIYNSKRNSANLLQQFLNEELGLIITTKALITKTLNIISVSNSSEEILESFNDYQNTVDSQNLPTQMTGLGRDAELEKFKRESSGEFISSEGGVGEMLQLQEQCNQIRQQMGGSLGGP